MRVAHKHTRNEGIYIEKKNYPKDLTEYKPLPNWHPPPT